MLATRTLAAVALAALAALGAPAAAAAARVIAPPGNSGVGQYVEVVPTAGGGVPVGGAQPGKGPVLPASTVRRLTASGPEGKALAAFAQSTGTPTGSGAHRPSSAAKQPSPSGLRSSAQYPVLRGTPHGSAGGLGLGLPLVLGAIALVGAALAVGRRVRSAS
jgi:hypothetical protein